MAGLEFGVYSHLGTFQAVKLRIAIGKEARCPGRC
jgi:hypothetical protein